MIFPRFLSLVVTVTAYYVSRKACDRIGKPWANPILFSLILVSGFLSFSSLEYRTYSEYTTPISVFLGPATVALSIPLYRHKNLLTKRFVPITIGVSVGSVTGMVVSFFLGAFLGLPEIMRLSMLPKSVTIPVGMEINRLIGGDPSLGTVFTVLTALTGTIIGTVLMNKRRIDPTSQGLALGGIAHGLGIAVALDMGQIPAALAVVAMVLAGVITSIMTAVFLILS